jgi:NlpC/P60 family putative phage cell wall peptidase
MNVSPSRDQIVQAARAWIGTPYRHQASLQGVGCDCLGLVRGVWRQVIGPEPELPGPYGADWAEAGGLERLADAGARHFTPVAPEAFGVGDVLLFRRRDGLPAKHAGIATSSGSMIHAHDGASVCEVAIGAHWRRRIAFAFAFPGLLD